MVQIHKKTGLSHLWATVMYAFDALKVLSQETAFRHEVIFLGSVFVLFAFLKVSVTNYMIMTVLWLILVAFEAINTALEHIVDRLSPEISDFAKKVKDLGSLAVFFLVGGNIAFVFYIIITYF